MSKQDRDILDDMFRAKLYDHEVDTTPEDWEMIVNRLPESKPVVHTLRRRRLYWSVAAAIAGLIMATGIFFFTEDTAQPGLADLTEKDTPFIPQQDETEIIPSETETPLVAGVVESATSSTGTSTQRRITPASTTVRVSGPEEIPTQIHTHGEIPVAEPEKATREKEQAIIPVEEIKEESQPIITQSTTSVIADAGTYTKQTEKVKTRRWGFGMGGGSLTANSQNTFNGLVHQVTADLKRDDDMMIMNAPLKSADYQTELTHKTPVNVGLSGSYYLTNRWALQFGLSYSLLVSESKQNTTYHRNEEQRLHFIGIPISISYKIAEWNALQVYAAAGFMPEINVAGKFRVRKFVEEELTQQTTDHSLRMRELYWSVNARGGVSYPLLKYTHVFAEVGAGYYFDNNSSIKTIHSEKPFNVSFNFGLRFGF